MAVKDSHRGPLYFPRMSRVALGVSGHPIPHQLLDPMLQLHDPIVQVQESSWDPLGACILHYGSLKGHWVTCGGEIVVFGPSRLEGRLGEARADRLPACSAGDPACRVVGP